MLYARANLLEELGADAAGDYRSVLELTPGVQVPSMHLASAHPDEQH